jgi:hypothetical protein
MEASGLRHRGPGRPLSAGRRSPVDRSEWSPGGSSGPNLLASPAGVGPSPARRVPGASCRGGPPVWSPGAPRLGVASARQVPEARRVPPELRIVPVEQAAPPVARRETPPVVRRGRAPPGAYRVAARAERAPPVALQATLPARFPGDRQASPTRQALGAPPTRPNSVLRATLTMTASGVWRMSLTGRPLGAWRPEVWWMTPLGPKGSRWRPGPEWKRSRVAGWDPSFPSCRLDLRQHRRL